MDEEEWFDEPETSRSRHMAGTDDDDDHDSSDHDTENHSDDEMGGDDADFFGDIARRARESGLNLDDATAAAFFGGGFRAFGGMMSGMNSIFKRLLRDLHSPSAVTRLSALRECSEILLVSNEDTLASAFSTSSFATEFIAILKGQPNIEGGDGGDKAPQITDDMDEDAQMAAALAFSTGGELPAGFGNEDEMECQLVACRCLAHLLEALPGSGHTLVHLGAVPVLCSKLTEIAYIELAEQTLSVSSFTPCHHAVHSPQTMEKISVECPSAIVRAGGLTALLSYLPFFSTNVQRTAVTAAANCCRNISIDYYDQVKEVFPTLRETLTQPDQRLVEQAGLAVMRTLDSYRTVPYNLEGLLDLHTVIAVNNLLMPSGGSPLLTPGTYTHLLRALTISARASAKVAMAFFQAGMTDTLYQILTGVLPSSRAEEEQGASASGQGLGGGVADMAVLQNLAHRPKDQVEEALALICELLPPTPRDGVFDWRGYTEKSLNKIKAGRQPESSKPPRRSHRHNAEGASATSSAGPSTPAEGNSSLPTLETAASTARETAAKTKLAAEELLAQRLELFRADPTPVAKFTKSIVPVLVDVYADSVATRVRSKVLLSLLRAIAFAQPDDLRATLRTVPMASFLCAIISSKDHSFFVLNALHLVEILVNKLPDVYQLSFQREGVVFEVEALAAQELTTEKAKAAGEEEKTAATTESATPVPPASSSALELPPIPDDLKPMFAAAGLPSAFTAFLNEAAANSASPRKPQQQDPNDANILRARVLLAKKIFSTGEEGEGSASAVLQEIAALVGPLCRPAASESEIRDILHDLANRFVSSASALSSFELLKSGLVDGLLEFVDVDGAVSAAERRAMLFDIFARDNHAGSNPMTMLVKRLHESLSRLENFQVETAFGGVGDGSSSGLTKTMRVRLQAEEGQEVPKHLSTLSVTIQAIAPLQALHDYLRPRVADNAHLSGNLSSMFAAYAAGMSRSGAGGSGSASERLLDALASARGQEERTGTSATAQAPTANDAAASESAAPAPSGRRRSARLSALSGPAESNENQPATDAPPATSSSEPRPSIFASVPMDMDFDDDEGYSEEEEFDTEVFEDEMGDEMDRPREQVVNMSVAADGSRVEAKTPEGTRIATPSQNPPAQAAPSGSGTTTPRTASYAGALKSTPSDFHLEFTYNGKVLALDNTVYGAVHKGRASSSTPILTGTFGVGVLFKYRKVEGPPPTSATTTHDAPTPGSVGNALPHALDPSNATSKIIRLLRVIHDLSLDAPDSPLDEKLFINNKLTAKLTRQLEEIMIIASNCLPDWAVELPKHFFFLFPFETRYHFLQSTSFGYGRLIAKSQSNQNSRGGRNRDDISHLARIVRQKVRISRAQLLESCAKVLELYGTSQGILEVEYFDEIGTGLGPTLEFYSIASREFARKNLRLWRDEDSSLTSPYVSHPRGLYPAPMRPEDVPAHGVIASGSRLSWYKTLGLFVGRALLDSRIIDVNLNKVFLRMILGRPVNKDIATLKLVDPALARSLERLQKYSRARKEIEALQLSPSARQDKLMALSTGGVQLSDLSLDFTLPGYYDIELVPGGAHIDVDDSNLDHYLERIFDYMLGSGVRAQVKAFQEGFSMIFPIEDMKIFSADELGLLFGNAEEDWSRESLERAIKADHGFTLGSRAVQNLIEVMSSYSLSERREFLQFITGAPKLPIGGFQGLSPPFTVVRKPHEPPFRADDYLPSVMTCAQYLKMPDYSSKEVLAAQLQRAMRDGGGSFHLS